MSERSEPEWMPRLRAAARRVREQFDVNVVAAALGLDVDGYLAWEAGDPTAPDVDVRVVASTLGIDLADMWDSSYTRSRRSLRGLWAAWGPDGGPCLDALSVVTKWARVDDRLTLHAEPREPRNPERVSLADRGVPEAAGTVFVPHTLPAVTLGRRDENFSGRELAESAPEVAQQIRVAFGVEPDASFNPWLIADRYGVAAGLAPLGADVYSVTMRVRDGYAVVVSSTFNETVRRAALTHALVHLAAGDVLLSSVHWVPDEDDDSIYRCSPIAWERCVPVDYVVEELLDPVTAAATRTEWARIEAGTYAYEPPKPPAPVRLEGEAPGYWEAYEVVVPPVSLRRELGRSSRDALHLGPGESRWPASLARRWVAVVSRGFTFPVGDVEQFPFGAPGCPTVEDVEQALWRERIVRAQLNAWSTGSVDPLLSGME